jgi:hypothetical protein
MNLKEIVDAYNNGTLQYEDCRFNGVWYDCIESAALTMEGINTRNFRSRPPEPKLRPWRPEEVPVGALIKMFDIDIPTLILGYGVCKDSDNTKYVQYVHNGYISGDGLDFCMQHRKYSTDQGKTWKPCGVME